MAARAIYWAATHRRRELWVGWPAVLAIIGTRLLPAMLDHKLARQAYDGQMSDQPLAPGRHDNLYQPLPEDHGAHGRFDAVALNGSAQLWLTTHRWVMVAVGVAVLAALGAALSMG